MRAVWQLGLASLLLGLFMVLPVQATTIVSEGFEYTDFTAMIASGKWATNCIPPYSTSTCTTSIVSSPVHGGSHALKQVYGPSPYNPDGSLNESSNSVVEVNFSGIADFWERYYGRFEANGSPSNFGLPTALQNGGAKEHYYNTHTSPNFYMVFGTGGDQNHVRITNQGPSITTNYPQNENLGTTNKLAFNTWHCFETHIGAGVMEFWIDGVRYINYGAGAGIQFPSAMTHMQIYRQVSQNLNRFEDDLVIATTRVGCGSGPVDPVPGAPATPLNFRVN
jgi:hypothetical protein